MAFQQVRYDGKTMREHGRRLRDAKTPLEQKRATALLMGATPTSSVATDESIFRDESSFDETSFQEGDSEGNTARPRAESSPLARASLSKNTRTRRRRRLSSPRSRSPLPSNTPGPSLSPVSPVFSGTMFKKELVPDHLGRRPSGLSQGLLGQQSGLNLSVEQVGDDDVEFACMNHDQFTPSRYSSRPHSLSGASTCVTEVTPNSHKHKSRTAQLFGVNNVNQVEFNGGSVGYNASVNSHNIITNPSSTCRSTDPELDHQSVSSTVPAATIDTSGFQWHKTHVFARSTVAEIIAALTRVCARRSGGLLLPGQTPLAPDTPSEAVASTMNRIPSGQPGSSLSTTLQSSTPSWSPAQYELRVIDDDETEPDFDFPELDRQAPLETLGEDHFVISHKPTGEPCLELRTQSVAHGDSPLSTASCRQFGQLRIFFRRIHSFSDASSFQSTPLSAVTVQRGIRNQAPRVTCNTMNDPMSNAGRAAWTTSHQRSHYLTQSNGVRTTTAKPPRTETNLKRHGAILHGKHTRNRTWGEQPASMIRENCTEQLKNGMNHDSRTSRTYRSVSQDGATEQAQPRSMHIVDKSASPEISTEDDEAALQAAIAAVDAADGRTTDPHSARTSRTATSPESSRWYSSYGGRPSRISAEDDFAALQAAIAEVDAAEEADHSASWERKEESQWHHDHQHNISAEEDYAALQAAIAAVDAADNSD